MVDSDPTRRLVQEALAGDSAALGVLVGRLTPVIQARVARAILARGSALGRQRRELIEDLTQEIFLLLFADDAKILRDWQPGRGLSIENFAGLVATRRALSILRSGKKSAWLDDPTLADDFDEATTAPSPERQTASKQQLNILLGRLRERLSPLGWRLFDLLLIQERTLAEVETETTLSRDAIYAWRSRLRRLAGQLWRSLLVEEETLIKSGTDRSGIVRNDLQIANDKEG